MKRTLMALIVILAVAGAAVFFAQGRSAASAGASKQLYTCGMHPQIIKDKPGDCPICGMKLQPIRKQPGGSPAATGDTAGMSAPGPRKVKFYKSTMTPGEISPTPRKDNMGMDMVPVYEGESQGSAISIDPVTAQNMGLRTALVTRGAVRRKIRTFGAVDYNESALSEVTTKFKGWIEKLYVDSTGALVHKGEPLFEIYSPDLYTAQNEYVLATARGTGMKENALIKLKYWDVSPEQIAELEKTGQAKKTLSVSAPRDGIVVEKMVVEGQMVDAGMKLYRIADLSTVWVQAQVYEQDLGFIKLGQESLVSLSYLPDRKFRGRVTYIYPTVDEKTRTAKVRMEFHNPGFFLKPGMFATVEIESEIEADSVLVPDMAVLRSGEKNTVFIALDGGRFEPRAVTLGARSENYTYQVLGGLEEGERVVTSGQFMLDSESQLREAIQKMLQPQAAADTPAEHSGHTPGEAAPASTATPTDESISFICPMPEHLSIKYQQAGKCPICRMDLVPVRNDMLAKLQPGGKVDHYTCPMPAHADVNLSKPGKCPQPPISFVARSASGSCSCPRPRRFCFKAASRARARQMRRAMPRPRSSTSNATSKTCKRRSTRVGRCSATAARWTARPTGRAATANTLPGWARLSKQSSSATMRRSSSKPRSLAAPPLKAGILHGTSPSRKPSSSTGNCAHCGSSIPTSFSSRTIPRSSRRSASASRPSRVSSPNLMAGPPGSCGAIPFPSRKTIHQRRRPAAALRVLPKTMGDSRIYRPCQ